MQTDYAMQSDYGMSAERVPLGLVGVTPPRTSGRHLSLQRRVNLAGTDLNLLVALEALLAERNVTNAANRVGLSQPAMSRALARLRGLFDDELLVRSSAGLVPTARSEQLATELPDALNMLRNLLASRETTPGSWEGTVNIDVPDHQALDLLPRLLPRLRAGAPGVSIVTAPLGARTLRGLESGSVDLAVGQLRTTPFGFYRRTILTDRFVCLLRAYHPALKGAAPTAECLAGLRYVVVTPGNLEEAGLVYDAVAMLEVPDPSPVAVQSTMAAAMLAAETDLVLIIPRRTAGRIARMLPLAIINPPAPMPNYELSLVWHERLHRDPLCAWLRAEMATALASADKGEVHALAGTA
jgi:DNA-binding transcriptional LysR family regulator